MRVLGLIPGSTTGFFSILSPHKHIPPHRGPWAGVLRLHLGLMVPEPRHQVPHPHRERGARVGGGEGGHL